MPEIALCYPSTVQRQGLKCTSLNHVASLRLVPVPVAALPSVDIAALTEAAVRATLEGITCLSRAQ